MNFVGERKDILTNVMVQRELEFASVEISGNILNGGISHDLETQTLRLGSVRHIVDSLGNVEYEAEYDGFGNITTETGSDGGDRYNGPAASSTSKRACNTTGQGITIRR